MQVVNKLELTKNELKFYQDYGYLLIPNFVNSDAISGLCEEVFQILEAKGFARAELNQAKETADKLRQFPDYLKGSLLNQLINSEETLGIASSLIGGRAIRYLPFTAVKAGGGGGQFHFHQDNNYTQHDPALGSINIWVALVDMTPENGCLQMVPASHLEGTVSSINAGDGDSHKKVAVDPSQFFPVRMRAGDAIAFTRLTIHGSGPNHTNKVRLAYALQYHREDVRYLDPEQGNWQKLTENPRFQTPALERLVEQ